MELKWAFGFEGAITVTVQPAVVGEVIFFGSPNGDLYAFNRKSGCAYWKAETKAYIDLAHAFNAEDKATLEAIQKNAKTNFRPIAHLAPEAFEGTIWDFTRQMARLMISN